VVVVVVEVVLVVFVVGVVIVVVVVFVAAVDVVVVVVAVAPAVAVAVGARCPHPVALRNSSSPLLKGDKKCSKTGSDGQLNAQTLRFGLLVSTDCQLANC